MDPNGDREFPTQIPELIDEFVSIIHKWDVGKYAIAIGGSRGKGTWDNRSDVDFRFYHEAELPGRDSEPEIWAEYHAALDRWRKQGIIVDGIWPRRIDKINLALDRWLDGETKADEMVWCIWGYHILADIYHQMIIDDPVGVIAGWKRRLQYYPQQLKTALLKKHLASLRYWRGDYHYANKVKRGDVVFLAGLSARLVHDIMQTLFALNETYYVGDGQNLDFARGFQYGPDNLDERIRDILYPRQQENIFDEQYAAISSLIDDILKLAAEVERDQGSTNQ
jgi:hypothetical protein